MTPGKNNQIFFVLKKQMKCSII